MSVGIVDTTVILHYFRNYGYARAWVDAQPVRLSIVSMTWMEVMEGASNKAHQAQCKQILGKFDLLYPTSADQQWAMQQLELFQFSHHIGKDDCLIASLAYRFQVPLYTHNLKDITPMIGSLAVKPYV
jgi:predicted nucleic acid-binding protein